MKRTAKVVGAIVAVLLIAPSVFAQGATEGAAAGTRGWLAVAAGFGMAVAAFGCALGQSRVASAACEGMARNPGAAGAIRAAMLLGLVFIETLLLFTLLIVFVKV